MEPENTKPQFSARERLARDAQREAILLEQRPLAHIVDPARPDPKYASVVLGNVRGLARDYRHSLCPVLATGLAGHVPARRLVRCRKTSDFA